MSSGPNQPIDFEGRQALPRLIAIVLMLLLIAGCAGSDREVRISPNAGGSTSLAESDTNSDVEQAELTPTSSAARQTPDSDFASAEDLQASHRAFNFESDEVSELWRKLERFYGVDGELAERIVRWATRSLPDQTGRHVLVEAIEHVVTTDAGSSGVLQLADSRGGALGAAPFWAPPRGELLVSFVEDDSKPTGFGPELVEGADEILPDQGILVFDQGTVGFFGVDGVAVGHLPREAFGSSRGSLIEWLASSGHRVTSMPAVSGEYPCFDIEDVAVGAIELCAREDNIIPSITVDGTPLVTEEHWAAFYDESGWDWEQARSSRSPVVGHYQTVDWDPASDTWLFAWSGECESRDTLLFRNDRLSHVTGQSWEAAPSSIAVGFVGGMAVYVTSPVDPASCGAGADPSAVYALEPGGEPVMIWSNSNRRVQAIAFGR